MLLASDVIPPDHFSFLARAVKWFCPERFSDVINWIQRSIIMICFGSLDGSTSWPIFHWQAFCLLEATQKLTSCPNMKIYWNDHSHIKMKIWRVCPPFVDIAELGEKWGITSWCITRFSFYSPCHLIIWIEPKLQGFLPNRFLSSTNYKRIFVQPFVSLPGIY